MFTKSERKFKTFCWTKVAETGTFSIGRQDVDLKHTQECGEER